VTWVYEKAFVETPGEPIMLLQFRERIASDFVFKSLAFDTGSTKICCVLSRIVKEVIVHLFQVGGVIS